MTSRLPTALLALGLVVTGCTGSSTASEDPSAPPSSSPSPTPVEVDWGSAEPVALGDGWTAVGCGDDDELVLCIERGGDEVGRLLARVGPGTPLTDPPLTEEAAMVSDAWGQGFSMCLPSAGVGAPESATVAGRDGVRYESEAFDGNDRDAAVVVHVIGFMARDRDAFIHIEVDPLQPDVCKAQKDEVGFTPHGLAAFGDRLDRVVAGSRFPTD